MTHVTPFDSEKLEELRPMLAEISDALSDQVHDVLSNMIEELTCFGIEAVDGDWLFVAIDEADEVMKMRMLSVPEIIDEMSDELIAEAINNLPIAIMIAREAGAYGNVRLWAADHIDRLQDLYLDTMESYGEFFASDDVMHRVDEYFVFNVS